MDTADLDEIQRINSLGILDGVTTNPSLISRIKGINGYKDIHNHYFKICQEVAGDISAEVIATDFSNMVKEGQELSEIHQNIVVKIPMTQAGIRAIVSLKERNIKTNCTLIFSISQALLAARAGATYISPFVGRLDDMGESGVELVKQICHLMVKYPETQVLAASIRNNSHVAQCAEAGADVASCPPSVFDSMFKHPLTDSGLEKFLNDYKKIK